MIIVTGSYSCKVSRAHQLHLWFTACHGNKGVNHNSVKHPSAFNPLLTKDDCSY